MKPTIIDLFCGAGGFSEGFFKAGFKIINGYDKWERARETYKYNHPHCVGVIGDDIEKLSLLPDKDFHNVFPDSDVIIGSPPCVAFSNSNRSGYSDKSLGIRLTESFLRVVARKKFKKDSILKYWIMENVPKSRYFINEKYDAEYLWPKLKNKKLVVFGKTTGIYQAFEFKVPSRRSRFFCGEFPEPLFQFKIDSTRNNSILTVRDIQQLLNQKQIKDPNWPALGDYPQEEISDNSYEHPISEWEKQKAIRQKQDKGYMGKMAFPDRTDLPSRTILANLGSSTREAIIFHGKKNGNYRIPTIRELATFMSFPLEYRFCGNSEKTKAKQVGNAVPPKMAYGFARSILKDLGRKPIYLSSKNRVDRHKLNNYQFVNLNGKIFPKSVERQKPFHLGFTYHIPYMKISNYRVELTNRDKGSVARMPRYITRIAYSQGPKARVIKFNSNNRVWESVGLINSEVNNINILKSKIVSHWKFQKNYCSTISDRKKKQIIGPYELLEEIKRMIYDRQFPDAETFISYRKNYHEIHEIPIKIFLGYKLLKSILNGLK